MKHHPQMFTEIVRRIVLVSCLTYPYWVSLIFFAIIPVVGFAWMVQNVNEVTNYSTHASLILMQVMTLLMYYYIITAFLYQPLLRDSCTRPLCVAFEWMLQWATANAVVIDGLAGFDEQTVWNDMVFCFHPAVALELKSAPIAELLLRRRIPAKKLVRSLYLFRQANSFVSSMLSATNDHFAIQKSDTSFIFNEYGADILMIPAPVFSVSQKERQPNKDCLEFMDATHQAILNSSSYPHRQMRIVPVYIEGDLPEIGYFWSYILHILCYGLPPYYVAIGKPVECKTSGTLVPKDKVEVLNEYFANLQYAKSVIYSPGV